ncbi:MAG: hypothetical protein H6621_01315 [Halobacteriovoraceae bacterium]|nr:hypothetical protein [Halobacteriovoraceae bacterium]
MDRNSQINAFKKKNVRENFFFGSKAIINHKFQFRLVFANLFILTCFFASTLAFISYKIDKLNLQQISNEILKVEFMIPITAIFVVFTVFSIILNLYQSFKASAPIYRLCRYLKDVASTQEILPLSFRKKDYYQELPPLVIEAFMRLKEKGTATNIELTQKKSKAS